MAWHMGHPLSQTLFTSLYLDKLLWPVPRILEDTHFGRGRVSGEETGSELVHIVLRAYCLGLVKCCDFVHTRVTAEFFYEVRPSAISLKTADADRLFDVSRKKTSARSCITAHYYHILTAGFSATFWTGQYSGSMISPQ
jgi:hypothetical protein